MGPLDKIQQQLFFVEQKDKVDLLKGMLDNDNISRALIFSRTKYGADKLVRKLRGSQYKIEAMHGNKSQQNRQRVLDNFKNDKTQIKGAQAAHIMQYANRARRQFANVSAHFLVQGDPLIEFFKSFRIAG